MTRLRLYYIQADFSSTRIFFHCIFVLDLQDLPSFATFQGKWEIAKIKLTLVRQNFSQHVITIGNIHQQRSPICDQTCELYLTILDMFDQFKYVSQVCERQTCQHFTKPNNVFREICRKNMLEAITFCACIWNQIRKTKLHRTDSFCSLISALRI